MLRTVEHWAVRRNGRGCAPSNTGLSGGLSLGVLGGTALCAFSPMLLPQISDATLAVVHLTYCGKHTGVQKQPLGSSFRVHTSLSLANRASVAAHQRTTDVLMSSVQCAINDKHAWLALA